MVAVRVLKMRMLELRMLQLWVLMLQQLHRLRRLLAGHHVASLFSKLPPL
jgi:hypothetical protein